MAKQTYTDIDELVNDLINDLSNSLGHEIGEEMKKVEQEVIDSNVYGAYSPKEYERRGKDGGGLGSEGNMEVTIIPTSNGVTIELHNSTTGNSLYKNYWQGEIQDLIETGNYLWHCGCPSRPFIEDTQEKIDVRIDSIVESVLNKLGW